MVGSVKLIQEKILQVTVWEPASADERNERGRGLIRNPFHCFTLLLFHSTEPCRKESHDKSATTISGTLTRGLSIRGVFRRVLSSHPEPGYKTMHEAHVLARRITYVACFTSTTVTLGYMAFNDGVTANNGLETKLSWLNLMHNPVFLLLLLEALQLQRSFGLLNEFFPFGSVSDAVLPVSYSHVCYITFNIILPPVFRSSFWSWKWCSKHENN